MKKAWTAPDGTLWPITGWWCPTCAHPMAKAATTALGAHPNCCCWRCGRPLTSAQYGQGKHEHELCAAEDRAGQLID